MKLTNEQLWNLSEGAVRCEENEAGELHLCRYGKEGEAHYAAIGMPHPRAMSGVRLLMRTDADTLRIAYRAKTATSRFYCFFDATIDGQLLFHWGHEDLSEVAAEKTLSLPEGTHDLVLYFPALFEVWLREVSVNDGAAVEPIRKKLNYLAYGDSITQGYDARYPSQSYSYLLADKLGASLRNLGVGGAWFDPAIVEENPPFHPDVITVAYGTNDWSHAAKSRAEMETAANAFYDRLLAAYPTAKIFAVTPLFRMDYDRVTAVGSFADGVAVAREAAAAHGVTVISGENMIPHISEAFSDGYLHPNEFGFKCYAAALYGAMKPYL